jgi:hypothetical protein
MKRSVDNSTFALSAVVRAEEMAINLLGQVTPLWETRMQAQPCSSGLSARLSARRQCPPTVESPFLASAEYKSTLGLNRTEMPVLPISRVMLSNPRIPQDSVAPDVCGVHGNPPIVPEPEGTQIPTIRVSDVLRCSSFSVWAPGESLEITCSGWE